MKKVLVLLLVAVLATAVQAAVVEYWDYEDGVDGTPFTDFDGGAANGSGGSTGVNGTLMRGWDNWWGPDWSSAAASPTGGLLGMTVQDEHEDGYVTEGVLHNWTSSDWTLQLHAYFEVLNGWETIVGRDGSSFAVPESDFYFQRAGDGTGTLRLNYRNASGNQLILNSSAVLQENQWYGLAVVGDSTNDTLSLYIDSGSGYVLDGQLTGQTDDLGVFSSAINWTFGRGWYNGGFGDRLDGYLDNVQFDDTALTADELASIVPEPATMVLLGLGSLVLRRKK